VGYTKKQKHISRDYLKTMWERSKMAYGQFDATTLVKKLQLKKKQEAVRRTINTPKRLPPAEMSAKSSERSYERRSGLSQKRGGKSKRREREKRSGRERPKKTNDERSARQGANLNVNQNGNGTDSEAVIIVGTDLVTEGAGKEWMIRGSASLLQRLTCRAKKSTGWNKKHLPCS
jgi:hypothetical protein